MWKAIFFFFFFFSLFVISFSRGKENWIFVLGRCKMQSWEYSTIGLQKIQVCREFVGDSDAMQPFGINQAARGN